MSRILCIDYGDRNIGVAVSDVLGLTAQAVTVIRRDGEHTVKPVLRELAGLISEYGASSIALGYPRNMDGSEGFRCEKTLAFKQRLENRFDLPVILWDERLSTVGADRGLTHLRKDKRDGVIDKMAAVFILQGYLDYLYKRREQQQMSEYEDNEAMDELDEEFEDDAYESVTLVDENGGEVEHLIVDELEDNGTTYYLLIAADDEDNETADAVILKEIKQDGEAVLGEIEDDAEFDRVSKLFENEDYQLEV